MRNHEKGFSGRVRVRVRDRVNIYLESYSSDLISLDNKLIRSLP